MKKRKFCFLLLMLICFLVVNSCEKKEILIGFSGQLTGINADLGVHCRNGVILAIEEINSSGGIQGRKLRVMPKDDEGLPEKAVKVDKELIDQGVVAIIGHMTSSQTMAAVPVIEKGKTVLLSPTTSTPKLAGKKDMFFRVQGISTLSAKALGEFLDKILNLSRVIMIRDTDNNDYTEPYKISFEKSFMKSGNKVLHEKVFSSRKPESLSISKDILNGDYDGVFIIASARATAFITQSIRKKDKKIKIIGCSWSATHSLIRHGGKAVEGLFFAKSGIVDKNREDYLAFYKKFKKRFGKKPSFPADQGYHATKILAKALEITKGKKEGLENALLKTGKYKSFHGDLSFNEFGDADMPVSILKVADGDFVKLLNTDSLED